MERRRSLHEEIMRSQVANAQLGRKLGQGSSRTPGPENHFKLLTPSFPQPGLPLGFLLSLKESVGVGWAAGSPMTGGWFPRLR